MARILTVCALLSISACVAGASENELAAVHDRDPAVPADASTADAAATKADNAPELSIDPVAVPAPQAVNFDQPNPQPGASSKLLIDPPVNETEKLARQADFAEAMSKVEDRQRVFETAQDAFSLNGSFAQGGVLFGQVAKGSTVKLDGDNVMVDEDGRFVIGFGRDSALTALLTVAEPGGEIHRKSIELEDRTFKVDRIDGLDQSKVSGFTEAQLKKIGEDSAKKKQARSQTENNALWAVGFDWPLTGRISGVFGSQRILNGEPKRPHSGVDVARPTGTPIKAPADGIVTLAETDMYFEGGLVLLDHGQWLESAFLHMSRIDVEPGQQVKKGDVIGAVGATGRVTGPHLHWSVKWVGRLVDPQLLVGEMETAEENSE